MQRVRKGSAVRHRLETHRNIARKSRLKLNTQLEKLRVVIGIRPVVPRAEIIAKAIQEIQRLRQERDEFLRARQEQNEKDVNATLEVKEELDSLTQPPHPPYLLPKHNPSHPNLKPSLRSTGLTREKM